MKRKIIILIIVTLSFANVNAQNYVENLKGKLYIAPDFGLMFGSINRIEFSPAIGYHLTDRFSIAGGFKYEFYSTTRVYTYQSTIKTSIYGPKAFLRYTVINNFDDIMPIGLNAAIFAHAEYEANSLETDYFGNSLLTDSKRFWHDSFLIGGGISQSPSQRLRVNILFLWDTNTGNILLYNNPIIRFGIQIYLIKNDEYPE